MHAYESGPVKIIVCVATEIGIAPTVTDACSAGNEDAAKRSIESLKFAGDALIMHTENGLEWLSGGSAALAAPDR